MLNPFRARWSHSTGVLWLVERLGQHDKIAIVDIRAEGGAPESNRAIQSHETVPAIAHDGIIVTERAAITIHLGDVFAHAHLAPAIGGPARAKYLTWPVYCDSVFDPALAARGRTDGREQRLLVRRFRGHGGER